MKISQAEARRLRKRVKELEEVQAQQRNRWHHDFPGGVHMGYITRDKDWLHGRLDAARMLGHPVVVTVRDNGELHFYAVK